MSLTGKPTPLYEAHLRLNAKMVEYAGWLLPVQYAGISAEHLAVRQSCGLFDVSHMGEIEVSGPEAAAFLNFLLPRGLNAMEAGRAYYSPMCQSDGGTVDDLIVYPLAADRYLMVVNAANTGHDFAHVKNAAAVWAAFGGRPPEVCARSAEFAQLALQGPTAAALLARVFPAADQLKPYRFFAPDAFGGVLLSRTGYTGEDGFEIALPPDRAAALWQTLLDLGALPAGLGARDSLRLEAGMPLYGHELAETITPLEAGLSRFIALDKPAPGFIGQDALLSTPPGRRLIGLRSLGRAIPRAGYPVIQDGRVIGQVTSGGYSPSLAVGIAMALVAADTNLDTGELGIRVRDREEPFAVSPLPFVKRTPARSI
jgi:aminomethyltransferase